MPHGFLAAGLAAALSMAAAPRTSAEAMPNIAAAALQQDLSIAQHALEEGHSGIDRYVPLARSRAAFAQARAALTQPMSELEFYRILAPALFSIEDGHLSLYLSRDSERWLRERWALLPMRIRFIAGRPFVSADLMSADGRYRGWQLLSVNGVGAGAIARRLIATTRGDGSNDLARLRRNEGFTFGEQLVAMLGLGAPYRLTVRNPRTGRQRRLRTAGLPLSELQRQWATRDPAQQEPASNLDLALLGDGVARLTIRSFGRFTAADHRTETGRAIAQAFDQLASSRIRALILDLRGNGGGADELGRILLSRLIGAPFRYYDDLEANRLTFTFAPYVTEGARALDSADFRPRTGGGFLFTGHPNWGIWQPVEPVFRGALYVLMDAASFSTTSELLTHLHWRHRATFIGEEAGGGYYGNSSGYMAIITLPNSRLRVRIPLITYRLSAPAGYPAARGVRPDFPVEERPEDLRTGNDRALDLALTLARRSSRR